MTSARPQEHETRPLDVYVPWLLVNWLTNRPAESVHVVDGSMAFVDISGFTKLTERLARRGRVVGANGRHRAGRPPGARARAATGAMWAGESFLIFSTRAFCVSVSVGIVPIIRVHANGEMQLAVTL